jgi:hypothetical protein
VANLKKGETLRGIRDRSSGGAGEARAPCRWKSNGAPNPKPEEEEEEEEDDDDDDDDDEEGEEEEEEEDPHKFIHRSVTAGNGKNGWTRSSTLHGRK